MHEVKNVITQFADDTALFVMYSEDSIHQVINTLARTEDTTGLKVSYEKTCMYRVGSLKNSNARLYTEKQLQWSDDDILMLGVSITNGPHQSTAVYDSILTKMSNVANTWCNRSLTITGKILLINTLMSSLFVYPMSVMPLITDTQAKAFYSIVHQFLWNNKKAKILMGVLTNSKKTGGMD